MLFHRISQPQPPPPADTAPQSPPPPPQPLWQRLREMADSMEEADGDPD